MSIKSLIADASHIVTFTGAGISTESGISDYRSQGGLWQRYQPVTIQEFLVNEESRREYWRRKKELYAQVRNATPNEGHKGIARLETLGKLLGVITQNIDGLHQLAGNTRVLELHGTAREVTCLSCAKTIPSEIVYQRMTEGEEIPLCFDCGGLLKPNTISFGQALNPDVLQESIEWARKCDLMLAIGSTLIVEPAASIPRIAKQNGAKLAIVNRDPTPLDSIADVVIHESIGEVFEKLEAQEMN